MKIKINELMKDNFLECTKDVLMIKHGKSRENYLI